MKTIEVKTQQCVFCGQASIVVVDVEGWEKFQAGANLSDAFPLMPLDVRELFISGTHPACWDKHIPKGEDD